MKKRNRRLLSLLLVLSVFAAFLSVGAFAVDVPEISCELGTALDYTIPLEGGGSAIGFEVSGGSLPSGLSVTLENGAVKLSGTPGASGNYSYQLKITTDEGTEEYRLTLRISEPAPAPTSPPEPTPTPTPAPTPTPEPTPVPTPSPTPVPQPKITKHPLPDPPILEGDPITFIAHADYADTVEWRIQSPDGNTEYNLENIGKYFSNCYAEGYDEDTVTIFNVRYEMNGWKVRAKFIGEGGSTFTNTATITVNKNGPVPPSITRDPFVTSDSDTLSVTANDPNNGVLNYQWYSSADNSNTNDDGTDIKIAGATSSTFVPPETPGTVYYYCVVWSTVDGVQGLEAKSRVAAVTHAPIVTPEPTPESTPEPTPVPPEPSVTPSRSSGRSSSQFLLILMGVLILALIAAAVTLVIVSRRERELEAEEEAEEKGKRLASEEAARVFSGAAAAPAAAKPASVARPEPEPVSGPEAASVPVIPSAEPEALSDPAASVEAEHADNDPDSFVLDGWYCTKCGSFNRGHNCSACGEPKPRDAVQYVCDQCGWTNPDPEHPPRFCPDCGAPFSAADKD